MVQDSSVKEAKQRQSQPVDLSLCLKGFTKEEEIAEWFVLYLVLFLLNSVAV